MLDSTCFVSLISVMLKFNRVCRHPITPADYTKIIRVVNSRIFAQIDEAQQGPYLTRRNKSESAAAVCDRQV